jgi:serine/threonine protein kinase
MSKLPTFSSTMMELSSWAIWASPPHYTFPTIHSPPTAKIRQSHRRIVTSAGSTSPFLSTFAPRWANGNHLSARCSSLYLFRVQFAHPFLQPCWMSPELIQGHHYDSSSDIWSFGITALELTQGRPPRSRESSSKVLVKIVQDDPPGLDREAGQYRYSRAFKEVVESCLVKDPSKRFVYRETLICPLDLMHSNTAPLPHNYSRRHSSKMPGRNHILSVQFSVRILHPLSCSTVNAICRR